MESRKQQGNGEKKETLKNIRQNDKNVAGFNGSVHGRPLKKQSDSELAERDYRIYVTNKIGRAKRLERNVITAIITAVITLAVILGVGRMIFSVVEITVEGNYYYSASDISEACDVDYGDLILTFDCEKAEQAILKSCPYIETVTVSRKWPGDVVISVSEAKASLYVELYGEYVLLSDSLHVLESTASAGKTVGLIKLILPNVTRAVEGEDLVLSNDGDLEKIREIIANSAILDGSADIVTFDFSDSRNARIICDGDYTVKLGDWKDSKVKLDVAKRILGDSLVLDASGAEIDVSYPKEVTVKPK